jgi:hypothetical protein
MGHLPTSGLAHVSNRLLFPFAFNPPETNAAQQAQKDALTPAPPQQLPGLRPAAADVQPDSQSPRR